MSSAIWGKLPITPICAPANTGPCKSSMNKPKNVCKQAALTQTRLRTRANWIEHAHSVPYVVKISKDRFYIEATHIKQSCVHLDYNACNLRTSFWYNFLSVNEIENGDKLWHF